MTFWARAAGFAGIAAGGVAAARLVASLTPGERRALTDLLAASGSLARNQAEGVVGRFRGGSGRVPSPSPAGGPADPSRHYKAGPLTLDPHEHPLAFDERGPHGEPPIEQSSARFAAASEAFGERLGLALDTEQLRKNLLYYQRTWRKQRDTAVDELPAIQLAPDASSPPSTRDEAEASFQEMRHRLAGIKDNVLGNLDAYIATFKANAARNGVTVYHAHDAAAANQYILALIRRHNATLVIKGKSMVTEEIHLNHFLEEAGIRTVETDFGEWIAQLDNDRPSHMISPIAHKNRFEVGSIISEGTGVYTSGEDIPGMAAIARTQLRRDFLAGQIGITGANALIASTGAVMLIENEGNGRLVSSLPPIHLAICGAEKLVPDMAAAMLQVRLLGRSGTGQSQTVYTTFVNGPQRPGREMHVVLLDNGRSKMLADPDVSEALRCIRCGACANVCPPYGIVGGHAFGFVYAGAIGLVTTPFHHGLENDADAQSLCLQCNACATVCPVEIPLPRQILDIRRRVFDAAGLSPFKKALMAIWREPRVFDRLARVGAVAAAPFATDHPIHGRMLTRLPMLAPHDWRTPPAPARTPARDSLTIPLAAKEGPFAHSDARGLTVGYFIQCITDRLYPSMAQSAVDILAACGARVVIPAEQHCCGLVADDAGDRVSAVAMARQTIVTLERLKAHWIVTGAASCAITMLHDFAHIFADEPAWQERARELAARTVDLTTFLNDVAKVPSGALARGPKHAVTYHSFCGSTNVLHLNDAPRRLISDVCGLELREMAEAGVCCGFGGSFSTDHPVVSRQVAERKLANADETGAPTIVTDNPGCIAHMRGAIHASGRSTRVVHMAELIAERLREVANG